MASYFSLPRARALLSGGGEAPHILGRVDFYPKEKGTLVVADVEGLPESQTGFFGFHIHEGENCTGEGFSDTKSHFDPASLPHPEHAGDLPPLLSCQGSAYLAVLTDRFGIDDVLGRTVVIHSDPDDFHTQPAGNAGKKIACGVIRAVPLPRW